TRKPRRSASCCWSVAVPGWRPSTSCGTCWPRPAGRCSACSGTCDDRSYHQRGPVHGAAADRRGPGSRRPGAALRLAHHRAGVHRTGQPAAMVVCDLGGYPVDAASLGAAAGLPSTRIVVDAAHGPGGDVGRGGDAALATCLSFYATKNLPIGEGGAVLTHDGD